MAMKRTRFQNFTDPFDPGAAGARLARLRERMRKAGLAAWAQPRSDAFQNEYLRPCDERLAWLSGFSGSAGLAIILQEEAALFVDGRYVLQARRQTDGRLFSVLSVEAHRPHEWLAARLRPGQAAGFDPWLMTEAVSARYEAALRKAGAAWRPLTPGLVDAIWRERPAASSSAIFSQPLRYAGMTAAEKLAKVRAAMAEQGAEAALITLPDSVSWLFNIRGRDIAHTPVVLAFALVPAEGAAELFIDPAQVPAEVSAKLAGVAVLSSPQALEGRLRALGERRARVLADPAHAARMLFATLEEAGAEIVRGQDPCLLPKALKTPAEQAGARAAHARDGAAMVRFLAWLETAAADGGVDEIAAAAKLEEMRIRTAERTGEPLFDLSFDTISAAGEHGAIVHYRVTEETARPLRPGELYLVDSGGQYRDGTTDITRTVFIGPPGLRPPAEARRRFTLVLKGMIALASARFPAGTTGAALDALARQFLRAEGLDYDHGTGHGVGAFLSVHEGPQSISRAGETEIRPGMIVSDEPGYYLAGRYGIRIENLLLCRPARKRPGDERALLSFETLSLCPIDARLIETALLDAAERAWLDGYHAHVRAVVAPLLDEREPARRWLVRACAPLAQD